ncbi:MAG: M48 family metalloprotease [Bacillota bacterium]
MIFWFSLFLLSALFKSSVESLNRLNKSYTPMFDRFLYTRIIFIVGFYLIIVERIENWVLLSLFVSIGLLLIGAKTQKKSFKKRMWHMVQFLGKYLLYGFFIALIVVTTYKTTHILYFVGYAVMLSLVMLIIYFITLKKIIPIFFHRIPIEYPYDDSDLLTNYPVLYNHIYMLKGKKVRLPMNALFTGFFKKERIYLSDALIARLDSHALKAIIYHELGHYHYKHLIKRLIIFFLAMIFFTLSIYIGAQYTSFIHAFIVTIMSLYTFSTLLEVLIYPLMHKQEYEADYYACMYTSIDDFKRGLKRINQINKDPGYHKIYQLLFTTHPSYAMRMRHIKKQTQHTKGV